MALSFVIDRNKSNESTVNLLSFFRKHESNNKFSVVGMVDQLTAMERVANTPIPISCEHVNSLFWSLFLT